MAGAKKGVAPPHAIVVEFPNRRQATVFANLYQGKDRRAPLAARPLDCLPVGIENNIQLTSPAI
jgi:hypothetical protein